MVGSHSSLHIKILRPFWLKWYDINNKDENHASNSRTMITCLELGIEPSTHHRALIFNPFKCDGMLKLGFFTMHTQSLISILDNMLLDATKCYLLGWCNMSIGHISLED